MLFQSNDSQERVESPKLKILKCFLYLSRPCRVTTAPRRSSVQRILRNRTSMASTTTVWLLASASGPWTTCLEERRPWLHWPCSLPFTGESTNTIAMIESQYQSWAQVISGWGIYRQNFHEPSPARVRSRKRFRDNRILKTSLFETVISRSISCNLGKKIWQYVSTDSFFLMVLISISFDILLHSLWKRSRVREMHCSAVSQLSQTAHTITMQPK